MTKKGEVLKRKHLKSKDEKVWEIVEEWYEMSTGRMASSTDGCDQGGDKQRYLIRQ